MAGNFSWQTDRWWGKLQIFFSFRNKARWKWKRIDRSQYEDYFELAEEWPVLAGDVLYPVLIGRVVYLTLELWWTSTCISPSFSKGGAVGRFETGATLLASFSDLSVFKSYLDFSSLFFCKMLSIFFSSVQDCSISLSKFFVSLSRRNFSVVSLTYIQLPTLLTRFSQNVLTLTLPTATTEGYRNRADPK